MTDLDAFLADVGASQLGWPESLRFTYDATRDLLARGVSGDLVECGVGAGCHPAVMARACIDVGETRTVRLFDSFQGVPHGLADKDAEWSQHYGDGSGRLEATGVAACSMDDVTANLARWLGLDLPDGSSDGWGRQMIASPAGRLQFHRGWFQDTIPEYVGAVPVLAPPEWQGPGPIAFLRLDGDLYESTHVCLEHLYPLVSSGGVVVVDDWNLDGCRQAVRDYFASLAPAWEMERPRVGFLMHEVQAITESGDVYWVKP